MVMDRGGNDAPFGDPGVSPSNTNATKADDPSSTTSAVELARTYGGREVVAVALIVVIGAFAMTVVAFRDGTAVAAAMGSVTTLIGTLVGSYFGFQAGSQGRNQEAASADIANKTAIAAAAYVPEAQADNFVAAVNQMYANSGYGTPDFE